MDNQNSDTNAVIPVETSSPNQTESSTPSLDQRVIKIQFHLQNIAQSAIIIGQELIECKKEVGHGNWTDWLQNNFKLTDRTARRFMQIADRFSKTVDVDRFQFGQLTEMLALPEGEEENFIADKAAEGTPVQDMSVKKLRNEIKLWKSKANEKDAEIDNLHDQNKKLQERIDLQHKIAESNAGEFFKLRAQYQQLQQQKTVEVFPPDYEDNKQQIADLQAKIAELQNKLAQPAIEVVPDDYEQIKKQLADLQAQKDFFSVDIATSQALNQFFMMANFLHEHQDRLADVLNSYLDSDPLTPQRVNKISFIAHMLSKILDNSCK